MDFAARWAEGVVGFYRRWITDIDGHHCRMAPTCSRYGLAAIRESGWWGGGLATVDRLNRCGHDLEFYRLTETADGRGYLDPPECDRRRQERNRNR